MTEEEVNQMIDILSSDSNGVGMGKSSGEDQRLEKNIPKNSSIGDGSSVGKAVLVASKQGEPVRFATIEQALLVDSGQAVFTTSV